MNEKLYSEAAATRAGVAASTWRDYYADGRTPGAIVTGPGNRPGSQRRADGIDLDRGHVRPWWRTETVDTFAQRDRRPGDRTDLHDPTRSKETPR